jgi:DNA replication and repair protein RecF
MYVSGLSLLRFRSYDYVNIKLVPGINVFIGTNGQGKTNLIEALNYCASFSSHRVANDQPLVKQGETNAAVQVVVEQESRTISLDVEITPGKANRAKQNGSPLTRARELLGILLTVTFAPEDLMLVKGDPSERRKFMDDSITQLIPSFAGLRADFEKSLRQRNALLKSAYGKRTEEVLHTLDVWDVQLAKTGAAVMYHRLKLVENMQELVTDAYTRVSDDRGPLSISYVSNLEVPAGELSIALIEKAMLEALAEKRNSELDRGVTLVGPHRDELQLMLRDLPVRGYASHGESWSCALALKLSLFELLKRSSRGGDPVLILDDVFAELDEIRRSKLVDLVKDNEQTIVTAAVAGDVPKELDGALFNVHDGVVSRVE